MSAAVICSVVVVGGGISPSPCSVAEQVTAVVIWVAVVVTAVVSAVVAIPVVVAVADVFGGAVVMIAVVDVVAAGSTVFSSLPIPLQAPVAHSAAMQVTASPIARPVFLFVIINPSVLVVVVVVRLNLTCIAASCSVLVSFLMASCHYHQQYHRAEGYVYQEIADSTK